MAPSGMTEQLGRVLGGRYRLVAPIGRGASARVFLADDVLLGRQVAVKVLLDALADDQGFLRRFEAEAKAAASLNHPHILSVYDSGHDEGEVPWIVTEYLGGGSLRAVLDRGLRLTPSQALVVGLQTAHGLDYAHRRGFVHRDIKPANLLFDDDGRLRIADFGLARALAEAGLTEPQGAVLGTARYASPEQAQGQPLTGRADVYSLALVLVEAVTGEVPFAADTTLGTVMARIGQPFPRPEAMGPLAEVAAAAGAPDPDDRLDARALVGRLAKVAESLPRPAPLVLPGAIEIDPSPDRDPTTLIGSESADDPGESTSHLDRGRPGGDAEVSRPVDGAVPVDGGAETFDGGGPDDATVFEVDVPEEPATVVWGRDPGDVAADPTEWERPGHSTGDPGGAADPGDATLVVADVAAAPGRPVPYDALEEGDWEGPPWDPRSPTGRRRRWPRVAFWVLIVAALLAAVGALGLRLLRDDPRTALVPPVAGLSEEAATRSLTQLGWKVRVDRVREDGTTAGQVLRTRPGEGTELAEDRQVVLEVSQGPPLVEVPSITRGMARAEVERQLAAVGLEPSFDERFDEEVAAGLVIEPVDDLPATVEKGTKVRVVLSQGPAPRTIPDGLAGQDEESVVTALRDLGLVPVVDRQFDDDVAEGDVVSTAPAGGEQVPRGGEVAVVVSKGPDLVTVPDVSTAETIDAAVDRLEQAGLVAGSFQGPARGRPVGTDPATGTQVRRGAEVDIVLAAD